MADQSQRKYSTLSVEHMLRCERVEEVIKVGHAVSSCCFLPTNVWVSRPVCGARHVSCVSCVCLMCVTGMCLTLGVCESRRVRACVRACVRLLMRLLMHE